ncbi:DEAD/DEAH box helicase, partial [Pelomyxa schiedti]
MSSLFSADLFSCFDEVPARRPTEPTEQQTRAPPPKKSRVDSAAANTTNATAAPTNTNARPRDEPAEPMQTETQDSAPIITTTATAAVVSSTTTTTSTVSVSDPSHSHTAAPTALQTQVLLQGPRTKKCIHEVTLPVGYVDTTDIQNPVFPEKPKRQWKFELDPFQKMSIACLERNESVLVAAHTSAGKTVVAEYAIKMSLLAGQRVIYTSPIKALSNQKYRELVEEFDDVGLMTGDVTITPNASCLVMTTEILRSMLYRGSEVLREVAWVIFDEIHYLRNPERGVVWEETIILLPDKVRFIFLSATIPNAREFAHWITKIHSQPCHVVYTDMRPVPLQHYIFPAGGDGLHLVVDEKCTFREDNFNKALASLGPQDGKATQKRSGAKAMQQTASDCVKIIRMIMDRNYEPVIVFSFSKRDCEMLALQMSALDWNSEDEKSCVERIYRSAIESLSPSDQQLPQIVHILPLLMRGIGIHHSGLLPILKEIIEILFQEGLIKALFATETFSMGLNMPAKTVVFTSVRKFDGGSFRTITSGEYIQMSGRAGRRGLDERGIVILMIDERMEPNVAKSMVFGQSDPLNSAFYIGYNMLLNLLRVEGIDPDYLVSKSFRQFQTHNASPALMQKIQTLEQKKTAIIVEEEQLVSEFYFLRESLSLHKKKMREYINQPLYAIPFIQPGRLVRVVDGEDDFGWGCVVNFTKKTLGSHDATIGTAQATNAPSVLYIIEGIFDCVKDEASGKHRPRQPGVPSQAYIMPFVLSTVDGISSVRLVLQKDLRSQDMKNSVAKSVHSVEARFPDGIPLLDPIEDMQIEDPTFRGIIRKIESLEDKLLSNPKFESQVVQDNYQKFHQRVKIDNELRTLKHTLKSANEIVLKSDLRNMKRVLRRLGYTNAEDVIETKGRVACEISAGNELLITELMFAGLFNELPLDAMVSLLSCFIAEDKVTREVKIKPELQPAYQQMQTTARHIATISQECKLEVDVEQFVQKFQPVLMEAVYAWCQGAKFADLLQMTDIFEGNIIRALKQLEELMRQMVCAAKSIGNTELEQKFAEGITRIKRDIA